MSKREANRIPTSVVAGVIAAVAVGGGVAWWTLNSANSPSVNQAPPQASIVPSPVPARVPAVEQTLKIYWLKDTGKQLELYPKSVTLSLKNNQSSTVLAAAIERLLSGPKPAGSSSTIPHGTQLRSLSVQPDGIHLDLSQSFTSGGGSDSMIGRVAQVLYTATSLQPNAKVWLAVDGKPLEVLGGEGLELQQPLTRQKFEQNFTL